MRVIARGVGGVGRHGDAAGGHDAEIGDQPFRAVLADQRNAIAGIDADPLQRCGERCDLPCRLGPAGRAPLAVALGPQERFAALLSGPRKEQRNEIVEPFELARLAAHSLTAAPSLRGSAPPTQRPFSRSIALALKVPGGRNSTLCPSARSCGAIASRNVPLSTRTESSGA